MIYHCYIQSPIECAHYTIYIHFEVSDVIQVTMDTRPILVLTYVHNQAFSWLISQSTICEDMYVGV